MRILLAIIVLYGNLAAPWLCCCAVAQCIPVRVKPEPAATEACHECCQKPSPKNEPTAPAKPTCPCPKQSLLSAEPAPVLVERADASLGMFFVSDWSGIVSRDHVPQPATLSAIGSGDMSGPGVAEVLLKYHHRFLC